VRLQEAKTQELIATYQNTVLTAGREVQSPLRGFLKSQERAEDLARSVSAAAAATEVGVTQYRAGTIDFNQTAQEETPEESGRPPGQHAASRFEQAAQRDRQEEPSDRQHHRQDARHRQTRLTNDTVSGADRHLDRDVEAEDRQDDENGLG
jgi:hypothetical protein